MTVPGSMGANGTSHVCAFYPDKQDLIEFLVPYFMAGVANGDSCLWIVSGVLGANEAFESIQKAATRMGVRIDEGQMEVVSFDNWYLYNGVFQGDRVKDGWRKRISAALSRGHRRLRVTGDTSWVDAADWDKFLQYEDEVNREFADKPFTAVCTYPIDRTPRSRIGGVLASHQVGVVKRHGEWGVV